MNKNELMKFTQRVKPGQNMVNEVSVFLKELEQLYSYLITAKYNENDNLVEWKIQYLISQNDEYNTLRSQDIFDDIVNAMKLSLTTAPRKTIAFRQPSLELMAKLYKPFFTKLAISTHNKWNVISVDDAYQIANMTLVKLYRKDYYIHKKLLIKTFNNDVLLFLRQYLREPKSVSLDSPLDTEENGDSLKDVIPDKQAEEQSKEQDRQQLIQDLYDCCKSIALTIMSVRQFDQLQRDYGNKHTTSTSRKQLQRLKRHFEVNNITIEELLFYVLHHY